MNLQVNTIQITIFAYSTHKVRHISFYGDLNYLNNLIKINTNLLLLAFIKNHNYTRHTLALTSIRCLAKVFHTP